MSPRGAPVKTVESSCCRTKASGPWLSGDGLTAGAGGAIWGVELLTPSCRARCSDACALTQQLVRGALHQLRGSDRDEGVTREAELAAGADQKSSACEALGTAAVVSPQPGEQEVGVGPQRSQPAGDQPVAQQRPAFTGELATFFDQRGVRETRAPRDQRRVVDVKGHLDGVHVRREPGVEDR